ncbi:MAG: Ig-like domain-containing protein [Parabacteroides sp.]|nr:Ig-like domain-containing protein [Parabacteroides sp.]
MDKDGKVTAIAAGKATITVTTEDGSKTATCAVTVNTATALEDIIANTRVYGQEHMICIEPVMPINALVVSINGKPIYNDVVTSTIQIPVSSTGIYIVKLGTGNDISIRKVSVK